jgi:iron complex transport system permease protein
MNKYSTARFNKGKVSFLIDKKAFFILVLLLVSTITLFLVSTGLGDYKINPVDVIKSLFGYGTDMQNLVVRSFRLPRILIALLAGMCLAVAGALLQGIIRNPLASPDFIGISSGGAVAVVVFLAIFSNDSHALTVSIMWLPLAAFIGATIFAIIIYVLSWKNGVSPIRLVLIGVGIHYVGRALTDLFMIIGPIYEAAQANVWITGSVYGSNWQNVKILLPWTVVLLSLSLVLSRKLNVQELGDDVAKGVGSSVQKQRIGFLLISTALTGVAVAFAGAIGFVGLMAPHIGRQLVGSSFGALIPVSALIGAMLVLGADLIGRMLFLPLEVPAGVFTAGIGVPYFIYLLFRNRNS